jgi:uncharacterized protein YggE
MKNKYNSLLVIALAILLSFSPWSCHQITAVAENSNEKENPRYITTSGNAEIRVIPDEVVITLGIETKDSNLYTAKKENDRVVDRVISIAETYDIPPKHIQLEYIYIDQRGYYDDDDYVVRHTIVVTLQNLDNFEDFLTDVLKAGVTNVHGVQFRTTELRKYKDQARALAIQAAKEKAVALAGELNQIIGDPTNISEQYVGWYSWYSSWWGSYRSGTMMQNVVQDFGGQSWDSQGDALPGQISITAQISVTFEMEN